MKKLLGIWGLGSTGRAAVAYFQNKGYAVWGMDRSLKHMDLEIEIVPETEADFFCQKSDLLFASPGVDTNVFYAKYTDKWIIECDFFQESWKKPIIAVTGSVGKTSVVHILSSVLLAYQKPCLVGGNIGTPLFALLDESPDRFEMALLELSSFQLEYAKLFSPDIAIITNVYPNHLDRHKTFDSYLQAKLRIIQAQNSNQVAILPIELLTSLSLPKKVSQRIFISSCPPDVKTMVSADKESDTIIYSDSVSIVRYHLGSHTPLISHESLPNCSYIQNWLIIGAVLHALNLNTDTIASLKEDIAIPPHRLERIGEYLGASFYNDSKSTVPQSTLAAVKKFFPKQPLLFLGGESKGVNRESLIQELQNTVQHIFCFGKEATMLDALCKSYGIPSSAYPTLDDAFFACVKQIKIGDVVLFSPSGSSYDLFTNYQERGNTFKKLVTFLIEKQTV